MRSSPSRRRSRFTIFRLVESTDEAGAFPKRDFQSWFREASTAAP